MTATVTEPGVAPSDVGLPEVDGDGLLRYQDRWVALSPKEELAIRPLLSSWSRIVSRQDVADAVWPDGGVEVSALNSLVIRLRRRVQALGLSIETIRVHGFRMKPLASASTAAGSARGLSKGPTWLTS